MEDLTWEAVEVLSTQDIATGASTLGGSVGEGGVGRGAWAVGREGRGQDLGG